MIAIPFVRTLVCSTAPKHHCSLIETFGPLTPPGLNMVPSYCVSPLKYQSKNMLSTMPRTGMLGIIVPPAMEPSKDTITAFALTETSFVLPL